MRVEARQVDRHALEGDAGLDLLAVLAEELEIVHVGSVRLPGAGVGSRARDRSSSLLTVSRSSRARA